ncbi:MAG: hypothetical protein LBS17_05425, partial [Actinomycetes bacterium]|nr:hypothetical protein [Actinomycetes bacterium]
RTRELLPSFVKTTFDLNSFWGFIKSKFDNYAERRTFINNTGRGFLTRTAGFLVNRFAPQS